jgi:transcriptional regulator with XRE-family HTH domain
MREAKGWRPAELARAAETTEGQISRYENRQRVPSADVVAKLAIALEISADFFLGIDNRFADLPDPHNVASCLTLEWHSREVEIDRDEYVELLQIAREAESPPVSVAGWVTVRNALAIASAKAPLQPDTAPRRPLGRMRRRRSPGGLS